MIPSNRRMNASLDSHISIVNVKLPITPVFIWAWVKRANSMTYLSADAKHKPSSARRWLQVVLHGGKGIVVIVRPDILPEMPTVFIPCLIQVQ